MITEKCKKTTKILM